MKEYKPYFLYVGNVYPHKNLFRAIKALSLINKDGNKVNLYVVCSRNVFMKKLEADIKKLGAQDFVKFLGFVSDKNLKELYEKSIAFLYPSLTEGFGLPGLEALKAGTILTASNIPVFKEIYGNHAIYFDPQDVDSIKKALLKALSLKKLEAQKMIRENKKFVERYSWQKMARETLAVYNSLK